MLNLVEFAIENIMTLIPVRVIRQDECGVKFRGGRVVKTCTVRSEDDKYAWLRGVHFFWLFWEKIEIVKMSADMKDLPTQCITTKDDISVVFSVNIEYQVVDAVKSLVEVHDFLDSLQGAAMGHLARKIRNNDYKKLIADQADIESSLKGTLTTRVKDWGVKIKDVSITHFTRHRPIGVFSLT